jgi:hypothetical protein
MQNNGLKNKDQRKNDNFVRKNNGQKRYKVFKTSFLGCR